MFKLLRKNQNVADKELQMATTLKELAPNPYFSIINVHLVDINVFAKFYEIPSMSFKDIVKPKRHGLTDVKTVYTPTNTVCGGYNNKIHLKTFCSLFFETTILMAFK